MALIDVLEEVAQQTGLHRYKVKQVLKAITTEVVRRAASGEPVRISKFGTFYAQTHGPKTGRNMHTGEKVPIPARRVLKFRPSALLQAKFAE